MQCQPFGTARNADVRACKALLDPESKRQEDNSPMIAMRTASILVLAGLALCPSGAAAEGDLSRGEKLFARCGACHSVDGKKKIGPSLAGVVGRKAGSVEGVRYSKALAQSEIVWTEQNLDAYLAAPTTLVRGTTMTMRIAKEQERQDLIAYLKSLK
jgi:cytochrome c